MIVNFICICRLLLLLLVCLFGLALTQQHTVKSGKMATNVLQRRSQERGGESEAHTKQPCAKKELEKLKFISHTR